MRIIKLVQIMRIHVVDIVTSDISCHKIIYLFICNICNICQVIYISTLHNAHDETQSWKDHDSCLQITHVSLITFHVYFNIVVENNIQKGYPSHL